MASDLPHATPAGFGPAWWACFACSAVLPATVYLGALLWLGADTPQWSLLLMVLLLGGLLGWAVPAHNAITPKRAALAALAGLVPGWLFAVVITWGFALLGAWLLPAYAAACWAGRRIGMRRRA